MKTFRYDPAMVQPMRDELTQIGFEELLTPEAVDEALSAAFDQSCTPARSGRS